jgi:3-hydroxy-9,10-secoandrosta-1,3,5(10)-triene-9,17-dione monooxygenase
MSAAEAMARARAMVADLRARAEETERRREIHPDTVADLHANGLWRMMQPARLGGGELDYTTLVEVGAEIARGCGSTAWVFVNLAVHHWMLAMWPPAAQDEVWGENVDALIGSSLIYPCGKVKAVAGGWRLSGRWPFSSGIGPSQWVMVGGLAPKSEGGDAEPIMFMIRKGDLEVIDTWHVAGLAGTGSHDIACEDLFVADHMTLAARATRGGPTPGAVVNPSPHYAVPVLALFPHLVAAPLVGMAQAAFEFYVDSLKTRVSTYSAQAISAYVTTQLRVAEAGALIDGARLILRDNCDQAERIAAAGATPSIEDKARWRRDAAHSARNCVTAVDVIYDAAGGGANYLSNPLQRAFRDVHAGIAHIGLSWDINGAEFGRTAIGLPIGNPNV